MNWKDIAADVGKAAPLLGTVLGGPAGGAIGALVARTLGVNNDPESVASVLANPDAIIKLKQIESDQVIELQKLVVAQAQNTLAAETAQVQAINATMQTEAKSDHWPTYTWRPFIGFCFGLAWLGVYLVLPLCKVPAPSIPSDAWLSIGGILGVASFFRGKMQADPRVPTDNRG